jgi:hypothetical protein
MPDAPESTEIVKELGAAYEAIRALRDCTEPGLFFRFINGIPLLKVFGESLLRLPALRIVIRHRQEGDLLPDGTAPQMGVGCLATVLESQDESGDPIGEVSAQAWDAVCAAVEVLCLQDYLMQAPEDARRIVITRSDDPACFLELQHIEHEELAVGTLRRQSNDLLCLMLAEFAHTFGMPYRAIAELLAALHKVSAQVRTQN